MCIFGKISVFMRSLKYTPTLSWLILFFVLHLFPLSPLFAQNTSKLPDLAALDAYYEKARQDWDVPGLAIAIVKNDSVIFAKGYGVLNAKTGGAVNTNTTFG
ncbi:MAG: Beta-lactamase class C-like and penicillin binding proteins (PBPs) superfamily / DUF3471 domain, partial [uncultured Adhaeribacter sp.]